MRIHCTYTSIHSVKEKREVLNREICSSSALLLKSAMDYDCHYHAVQDEHGDLNGPEHLVGHRSGQPAQVGCPQHGERHTRDDRQQGPSVPTLAVQIAQAMAPPQRTATATETPIIITT